MQTAPRIIVLVKANQGYNRQVVRGVARHARAHGLGTTLLEGGIPKPGDLKEFGAVGVVAAANTRPAFEALAQLGLPVVNVSTWLTDLPLPSVVPDNCQIGELAAHHLLDRGFRHFRFYGGEQQFANDRWAGFCARLMGDGMEATRMASAAYGRDWYETARQLGQHLRDEPKPLAVFADTDERGRHLLEICRRTELRIPDEVAVLGVDNDEMVCEIATPPMSSVDTQPQRIGWEAAAMLGRLMEREGQGIEQVRIPPAGVVTRASTDTIAIEDSQVAAALHLIRSRASEPVHVDEVVEATGLSRRTLERRFRDQIGHGPAAEIRRQHVERAKWLLTFTDWNLTRVAFSSGFRSFRHLAQVFREDVGMGPTAYRKDRGRW